MDEWLSGKLKKNHENYQIESALFHQTALFFQQSFPVKFDIYKILFLLKLSKIIELFRLEEYHSEDITSQR